LKKNESASAALEISLAETKSQLEAAKSAGKQGQDEAAALKAKLAAAQKEAAEKEAALAALNRSNAELAAAKAQVEESSKALKEQKEGLSKDLKDTQKDKRDLDLKNATLNAELDATKESLANLQKDYKAFKDISEKAMKDKVILCVRLTSHFLSQLAFICAEWRRACFLQLANHSPGGAR